MKKKPDRKTLVATLGLVAAAACAVAASGAPPAAAGTASGEGLPVLKRVPHSIPLARTTPGAS